MRMQAIPVAQPGPQQARAVQTPQPIYVATSTSASPSAPYHEYEFVEQSQSPAPPGYTAYTHIQADVKGGYPEVPSPTSVGRSQAPRIIRISKPFQPPSYQLDAPSRHGVLAFFRGLFKDDEGEAIERAIVEEAKRQAEAEEAFENEQDRTDREARAESWLRIERMTTEATQIAVIQAEIARAEGHLKQNSERRAERSRQRENAREELTRYRAQRARVRILQAMSYTLTAFFMLSAVRTAFGCNKSAVPGRPGSGTKVLVARSNSPPATPPQSAQPPAPAQTSARRCGW